MSKLYIPHKYINIYIYMYTSKLDKYNLYIYRIYIHNCLAPSTRLNSSLPPAQPASSRESRKRRRIFNRPSRRWSLEGVATWRDHPSYQAVNKTCDKTENGPHVKMYLLFKKWGISNCHVSSPEGKWLRSTMVILFVPYGLGCGTPSRWPNSMAYKWVLLTTYYVRWSSKYTPEN